MAEQLTKSSNQNELSRIHPKHGQLETVDNDPSLLAAIKRVDQVRRSGDKHNDLPIVEVDIPESVTIRCPLISLSVSIRAANCRSCKYFQGVAQMTWSDESFMHWSQKYVIRCGRVIERTCGEVIG